MPIPPVVIVPEGLSECGDLSLRLPSRVLNIGEPAELELARVVVIQLLRALYSDPSGVAIAAPQIGVQLAIVVIDYEDRDTRGRNLLALLNPQVTRSSIDETLVIDEICLSVPNISASVSRPREVVVSAYDVNGKQLEITASGFLGRVLQHEIDHLNGILHIDRAMGLVSTIPAHPDRRLPNALKKLGIPLE